MCVCVVGGTGGSVCEVGDNHSSPDSGFYDAHLEQSVYVLADSTPGLQPLDTCLCNHFTAVRVLKTCHNTDFTDCSL